MLDTGLHPRPASPSSLSPLFPPNSIDESYASTYLPSRRGETLRELHDRADCFIEAWTARVEEMGVRCVVVFAHAASVIALGRAVSLLFPGFRLNPNDAVGMVVLTQATVDWGQEP